MAEQPTPSVAAAAASIGGPDRLAGVGRIGVGLWTFQSTATRPANLTAQYRRFPAQAALLERHGYHSVWTAEHRIWYDGWCPALLHAQAAAVSATARLRFGNAMLIAPQHDPVALARNAATLHTLSGGRVDLGLGLGHRDAEFDALGLRRDRRGAMMDRCLEVLAGQPRAGEPRDDDAAPAAAPVACPIWIGGLSAPAIERAAAGGHRIMLPQTVLASELAGFVARYRELRAGGVVGVMRDVWVEPDEAAAAEMRARVLRHYTEEAGAWWVLKGGVGFAQPEQMRRQLARVRDAALIGAAEHVGDGLAELFAAGADLVVIRPVFDFVSAERIEEQLERIAHEVGPMLPHGRAIA